MQQQNCFRNVVLKVIPQVHNEYFRRFPYDLKRKIDLLSRNVKKAKIKTQKKSNSDYIHTFTIHFSTNKIKRLYKFLKIWKQFIYFNPLFIIFPRSHTILNASF